MHHKHNKTLIGQIKITQKPIGFFTKEEYILNKNNKEEDVIIFEENLNTALDKDKVEIEIIGKDRDRKKGKVLRIIERNKTSFVGTLENRNGSFVLLPDDFKFYRSIEIKNPKDLVDGNKALIKMYDWQNPNINPTGEIIELLGKKGEHETEIQSILLDKGIVYDFSKEILDEAEKVALEFRNQNENDKLLQRKDFRNILTFTIDPIDAKDFDDALSYEEISENVLRIGVHIADVSHFVRPNGYLDKESSKRNFSTYLVDRTIPMLPEVLSNDLCSLNPNVDRFAFSSVFDIEKNTGKILQRWFCKTIINSDKRFTYEEAQNILNGEVQDSLETFSTPLFEMNRLANIYREENKKNGAIEFETDEVKFELDKNKKPIRIYKKERLQSMKMIEEWMLLANREVAYFISQKMQQKGGASIFRIHDMPKIEKIENLSIFIRALGHNLPINNGEVKARDINILLEEIKGHSSESLIKTATIRSMAKAVYSTKNIGHFGLAFRYYTHFTSPIRRYPDLLIHRILNQYLNNLPISKNEMANLQKISEKASEQELVVSEAERESIKYKQVEFMENKLGQTFDCVVSGLTEWGLYVENLETKIEGMIRLKEIEGDIYSLDEKNYCVIGLKTKKKYSLGDSVRAKLVSADIERKTLDFKLV